MNLQSREDLVASLRSKPFRDAFVSSRVSNTLALQIRAMRQERGWSQAYLAELLGTSQNAVYRLESPQYGKPSITTLKRLASIFDVGLAVWFAPFSKLVDRVMHLETEDIVVPSFDDDPAFHEREAASITVHASSDGTGPLANISGVPSQSDKSMLPRGAGQQQAIQRQEGYRAVYCIANILEESMKPSIDQIGAQDRQHKSEGHSLQKLLTRPPGGALSQVA